MPAARPITGQLDIPAWRNDDWFEFLIRVVGLDLSALQLVMEVREFGDVGGPPLIRLDKVAIDQTTAQGLRVSAVVIEDGVVVSYLWIRMDRGTLQELPYVGGFGDTYSAKYALLFGGRTRLVGSLLLPAHAFGADAAPDDRQPGFGISAETGVPVAGATLVISQDGGATVLVDGADLASANVVEARAAADRAEEALALTEAISSTSYRSVATYGAREAIPLDQRGNGMRIQVMEGTPRVFEWRQELFGPGAWTGLLNEEELTRRQLQHGTQGQDTIDGLPATLAAQSAALASLSRDFAYKDTAITAFTVSPAIAEVGTTVPSVAFHLEETGSGPFAKVITRGDGQMVWWLKSASHDAIAFADATITTNLLTIGDSLIYDIGPTAAGTAGLTLANPTAALYSQTIRKQALRLGVYPIAVALTGNTLPAGGTSGTVVTVNGQATTFANPDAFLHAAQVDADTHAMTGTLVGRQVTITYNPATPDTYVIAQTGGAAIAVPAGSIFVPDFAAMMTTRELWLMPGHNSMSLSNPAASFEEIRTTIDAIMAKRGNNRTLLMPFWLSEAELSLLPYFNELRGYLSRTYPACYVRDAQGRDVYEMLLASSTADDRARGLVSAALRRDDLHPNATGIGLIRDQIVYFRNTRLAGTTALTVTTEFTLSVNGKTQKASVRFMPRRFWGVSTAAALDGAGIQALGNTDLADSRAKSFTVAPAGQFIFYAYPASFGDPPAWILAAFSEPPLRTAVDVTRNGQTISYSVLRSTNRLTGSVAVGVQ